MSRVSTERPGVKRFLESCDEDIRARLITEIEEIAKELNQALPGKVIPALARGKLWIGLPDESEPCAEFESARIADQIEVTFRLDLGMRVTITLPSSPDALCDLTSIQFT